jgi:hypothetical protein
MRQTLCRHVRRAGPDVNIQMVSSVAIHNSELRLLDPLETDVGSVFGRATTVRLAGAMNQIHRQFLVLHAIVLTSFSGIDGLELTEVAGPTPAAGEQLDHVRAASLGPWDLPKARGAFASAGGSTVFPQVRQPGSAHVTIDDLRCRRFPAAGIVVIGDGCIGAQRLIDNTHDRFFSLGVPLFPVFTVATPMSNG